MKNEKSCPHCHQWSQWQGLIDDRCEHCGEYLREEERVYEKKRQEKRRKLELDFNAKWPLHVKPGDNFLVVILKKLGFGIFSVFMAIISLFAWIMFWIAS